MAAAHAARVEAHRIRIDAEESALYDDAPPSDRRRVSPNTVRLIRRRFDAGEAPSVIARALRLNKNTVQRITSGVSYTSVV
jgi:DNA invertase Pin-like site-specific DNA recombinase